VSGLDEARIEPKTRVDTIAVKPLFVISFTAFHEEVI
jgi:hypothetical protein